MAAPTADLSVATLVLQASLPVQLVMALLVFMSIASWTVIFRKLMAIRQAKRQAEEFEKAFWSGGELMALYERVGQGAYGFGLAKVFEAGMREFLKLRQ